MCFTKEVILGFNNTMSSRGGFAEIALPKWRCIHSWSLLLTSRTRPASVCVIYAVWRMIDVDASRRCRSRHVRPVKTKLTRETVSVFFLYIFSARLRVSFVLISGLSYSLVYFTRKREGYRKTVTLAPTSRHVCFIVDVRANKQQKDSTLS